LESRQERNGYEKPGSKGEKAGAGSEARRQNGLQKAWQPMVAKHAVDGDL
jgi:hypothetical protein